MSQLDESKFEAAISGCAKCDFKAFEVSAYLDRQVTVMLAQTNNDGRWTHDAAKLVDGVFRVQCFSCKTMAYDSPDCPRCHRANGLADALAASSRLVVPTRCPECKGTEMTLSAFAPATVKAVEHRRAAPTQTALLGDEGYHVAHIACVTCNWASAAEGCPLCGGPGPLRARP
jgi:hypothetical protein